MADSFTTMGEMPDGTWGVKKPKSMWILFLQSIQRRPRLDSLKTIIEDA